VKNRIKKELREKACSKKASDLSWFFKTRKGEYGYGDVFLGVTVPQQRLIVGKYKDIPLKEVAELLQEKIHEFRFCALIILVEKYRKGDDKTKKLIVDLYLDNLKFINNWDLVDVSAPSIIGDFFFNKNKKKLMKMLSSDNLWARRIAIISTLGFIRQNEVETTFLFAEKILNDEHDLIHKATGWMLREAGKKNKKRLVSFLEKNANKMPRTMLRYSIEKFTDKERKRFLNQR